MANTDKPFGLRPIGKVGQNRDAQGLSEYAVAASISTTIYQNDPVKMVSSGTIEVAAATEVLLGSLNGVFYTDSSTSKPTWANHAISGNAATDIVAFVSDDPYQRFEIQSDGTVAQTNIGNCADLDMSVSGSSANYISGAQASATMANTAAQLKIIALSKAADNAFGANANIVVQINEHFLNGGAGV